MIVYHNNHKAFDILTPKWVAGELILHPDKCKTCGQEVGIIADLKEKTALAYSCHEQFSFLLWLCKITANLATKLPFFLLLIGNFTIYIN